MGSDDTATGRLAHEMRALVVVLEEERYQSQIIDILVEDDQMKHYSVVISPCDLFHELPQLAEQLLIDSKMVLMKLDESLKEVERRSLEAADRMQPGHPWTFKENIHARLSHLPNIVEYTRPNVSAIRSTDFGKFLQVSGTVIRTGMVKILESEKTYECTNSKCRHRFVVKTDVEQDMLQELPPQCPAPKEKKCKSTDFRFVEECTVCTDYQEIKIQEKVQSLTVGSIPRSICVALENDLVDTCKAGDDVVVTGNVVRRWRRIARGARCDLEVLIKANYVHVQSTAYRREFLTEELKEDFIDFWNYYNDRPLAGRNVILRSIAPQIFGLFYVKLSVALLLAGGVGHVDARGTSTRGELHLLLIGDPGTGKSQFLRFSAKVVARSVLTTGIGTTSAGLTCTAVKDGREWVLEAGALVLADRGICCIDEFSSIRDSDRTTIHEAMEQQSISVAKAGMVCRLNSRCSVLAATNPKGKYDPYEDISVNTAIGSPLLSRFDLVLVLLDSANPSWDKQVSSYILANACIGNLETDKNNGDDTNDETDDYFACRDRGTDCEIGIGLQALRDSDGKRIEDTRQDMRWNLQRFQAYLSYIKESYVPDVSSQAEQVLMAYYSAQRQAASRSAARTTIRLLESLVRLAQAHAKLMCRPQVTLQDAVIAVSISELSQHTTAAFDSHSIAQSNPATDPDAEYIALERDILKRLDLQHLSLAKEQTEIQSPSRDVPTQTSTNSKVRPLNDISLTKRQRNGTHDAFGEQQNTSGEQQITSGEQQDVENLRRIGSNRKNLNDHTMHFRGTQIPNNVSDSQILGKRATQTNREAESTSIHSNGANISSTSIMSNNFPQSQSSTVSSTRKRPQNLDQMLASRSQKRHIRSDQTSSQPNPSDAPQLDTINQQSNNHSSQTHSNPNHARLDQHLDMINQQCNNHSSQTYTDLNLCGLDTNTNDFSQSLHNGQIHCKDSNQQKQQSANSSLHHELSSNLARTVGNKSNFPYSLSLSGDAYSQSSHNDTVSRTNNSQPQESMSQLLFQDEELLSAFNTTTPEKSIDFSDTGISFQDNSAMHSNASSSAHSHVEKSLVTSNQLNQISPMRSSHHTQANTSTNTFSHHSSQQANTSNHHSSQQISTSNHNPSQHSSSSHHSQLVSTSNHHSSQPSNLSSSTRHIDDHASSGDVTSSSHVQAVQNEQSVEDFFNVSLESIVASTPLFASATSTELANSTQADSGISQTSMNTENRQCLSEIIPSASSDGKSHKSLSLSGIDALDDTLGFDDAPL